MIFIQNRMQPMQLHPVNMSSRINRSHSDVLPLIQFDLIWRSWLWEYDLSALLTDPLGYEVQSYLNVAYLT